MSKIQNTNIWAISKPDESIAASNGKFSVADMAKPPSPLKLPLPVPAIVVIIPVDTVTLRIR